MPRVPCCSAHVVLQYATSHESHLTHTSLGRTERMPSADLFRRMHLWLAEAFFGICNGDTN